MGIGIKNEFITSNDLIFCLIYIAILAGAKGNLTQNKQDEIKAIAAEESLFEAFNIQPELKDLGSDDFADDAQNYPQFLGQNVLVQYDDRAKLPFLKENGVDKEKDIFAALFKKPKEVSVTSTEPLSVCQATCSEICFGREYIEKAAVEEN